MIDLILKVDSAAELTVAACRLRERALSKPVTPLQVIEVFERWSASLTSPATESIPGVAFLRLWLRRGSLEPILLRELGSGALSAEWHQEIHARLGVCPLGVVGHWPAGNVEIQPLLSASCALLGGNACLVRVPTGLLRATQAIVERLYEVDTDGTLRDRVVLVSFDHDRIDLQQAMAAAVDGAMIWGGADAVSQVRRLPFPHWARVAVFGPRLSIAAMDRGSWCRESELAMWCQRIARDVWQFDQQACSSPQTLFLEGCRAKDIDRFVRALGHAFSEENRAHPRTDLHPALSSAIALKRASWLLESNTHQALFPLTPDWTILLGAGSDIPSPTQGKTLTILQVEDLAEPIAKFGGGVQTLGLAVKNAARESALAYLAAGKGVDRIVKLGRMHVFGSPWDGADLVRPMTRLVRHLPSYDTRQNAL
jgi:hypothetical protein